MRSLRQSKRYRRDLLDIWSYVSPAGERAADDAIDRIGEAVSKLLEFPELGSRREDLPGAVRVLPVGRHLVFYEVNDGYVFMRRVVDGRRDLSDVTFDDD